MRHPLHLQEIILKYELIYRGDTTENGLRLRPNESRQGDAIEKPLLAIVSRIRAVGTALVVRLITRIVVEIRSINAGINWILLLRLEEGGSWIRIGPVKLRVRFAARAGRLELRNWCRFNATF